MDQIKISNVTTILYVRFCPRFDQNGCNNGGAGGTITEREALNSASISKTYTAGSNVSTYSTCKTTSAPSATTTTSAQIVSTTSAISTTSATTEVPILTGQVIEARGG